MSDNTVARLSFENVLWIRQQRAVWYSMGCTAVVIYITRNSICHERLSNYTETHSWNQKSYSLLPVTRNNFHRDTNFSLSISQQTRTLWTYHHSRISTPTIPKRKDGFLRTITFRAWFPHMSVRAIYTERQRQCWVVASDITGRPWFCDVSRSSQSSAHFILMSLWCHRMQRLFLITWFLTSQGSFTPREVKMLQNQGRPLIKLLRFLNKPSESLPKWVATPIDKVWHNSLRRHPKSIIDT